MLQEKVDSRFNRVPSLIINTSEVALQYFDIENLPLQPNDSIYQMLKLRR